ncbi:MAG: RNB domain-containing ribonuclease, partial [Victivallales bacterium]|nr:RNB domain-containing ribonuclease [Victivallales bacterium]
VRKMKRTRLSTYPQPHFGLGLDLYTQISSPLRRYADMVIQRQICAHLSGRAPEYTQQELFGIVDNVESTSSTNRALDREAKKFWLLEYLRRNCSGAVMDAVVVRQEGSLILVELCDYCERGVLMTRDRPAVGEMLRVRIGAINPKAGRMELEPVW